MSTLYSSLLIALCLRSLKALRRQRDKQTVTHSRLERAEMIKFCVLSQSDGTCCFSLKLRGTLTALSVNTFIYTYTFNKWMKKKTAMPLHCMHMQTLLFTYSCTVCLWKASHNWPHAGTIFHSKDKSPVLSVSKGDKFHFAHKSENTSLTQSSWIHN